jgi:hypothetical protein
MFGSMVLSVVLGLIFVYFVFSMACSKLNEVVAARLQWRADTLEKWLRQSLDPKADPAKEGSAITVDAFKQSSFITSVTSERATKRLPSYIAPQTFSLALLDLLAPGEGQVTTVDEVKRALAALPPGHPAKAPLTRIAIEAGKDLAAFRVGVERWFNDSMGRVSGWYKRRIQRWMLVYAAALSILLNVDSLAIARTLWTQDAVREAVVAQAQRTPDFTTTTVPAPGSTTTVPAPGSTTTVPAPASMTTVPTPLNDVSDRVSNVKKLGLPLGWSFDKSAASHGSDPRRWPGTDPGALFVKLLGLAFTTGALSLGAPFWFDVLNKVARLRSSGDRPSTSTPPAPSAPTEVAIQLLPALHPVDHVAALAASGGNGT